ncbi:hypothetical protein OIDMADRAFT_183324 [Oidiodendron maius Zn]|uniref:Uncharacterized protein n=1 Tax=Oidiodendron maius (strain Zn) TaxID=913774 RepID=A0A0C3GKF9_OIDMZ|nr:hypothetical protein OIDMADRAFT_183324 [Oidiodendron maius Zn]
MRDDSKSAPFASPMTLIGPVVPPNLDVRIETDTRKVSDFDTYAFPRAIKSSAGEAIGCAMFDDPNDYSVAVECLIVQSRLDDLGQQNLLPQAAPGRDGVTGIKVKRGLQIAFGETGVTFTPANDHNYVSFESIDDGSHRELQLPEEAGISLSKGSDTSVSAAANAVSIQGSGSNKLVDELATPPFRTSWASPGNTVGLRVTPLCLCEQQTSQGQSLRESVWGA